MAGVSPTQNSLKWMRKMGYLSAVVERWNPVIKVRHDLFGIIDIIGVGNGRTIAVQSTSSSNLASRITKIQESDNIGALVDNGWIVIAQGWRKKKNRWVSREYIVTKDTKEELCQSTISNLPPKDL